MNHILTYCEHFNYTINNNLIFKQDKVIGQINQEEKHVIIGTNKLKYGDFAVLIMEGYFDILGDNNDSL